jgi:hypothetical protein
MRATKQPDATRHYDADGVLVVERKSNPFMRSPRGGKTLSALMRPFFELLPPRGFGVITTTGRKSAKRRHKCIRAIVADDRAYIVMIRPRDTESVSAWVLNIRSDPKVRLRIPGVRCAGIARELYEPAELAAAKSAYVGRINRFDYIECLFHRPGRPNKAKIQELHITWFETGVALAIEL